MKTLGARSAEALARRRARCGLLTARSSVDARARCDLDVYCSVSAGALRSSRRRRACAETARDPLAARRRRCML